jgi:hypothetical protein
MPTGVRDFSLLQNIQFTQLPIHWVSWLFSGVKGLGREVRHFSAEVKNEWSCNYSLPLSLEGVDTKRLYIYLLLTNFMSCKPVFMLL